MPIVERVRIKIKVNKFIKIYVIFITIIPSRNYSIKRISNKTELQDTKDAHEEQINATKEVDDKKSDDHTSVIEIEISKLVD